VSDGAWLSCLVIVVLCYVILHTSSRKREPGRTLLLPRCLPWLPHLRYKYCGDAGSAEHGMQGNESDSEGVCKHVVTHIHAQGTVDNGCRLVFWCFV
jgi:hypothetical protein